MTELNEVLRALMSKNDDKRSQSRADAARVRRAQRDKVVRRIPRSRTPDQVAAPRRRRSLGSGRATWRGGSRRGQRPAGRQWQNAVAAVPRLTGELIFSVRPSWRWASASVVILYLAVLLHFLT